MEFTPKKLSLIHLTRGLALLDRIRDPREGADIEMVAVYNASVDTLRKAKDKPEVLDQLMEDAANMDSEEAALVVANFFERCVKYRDATLGSLPQVTQEILARIMAAQSQTS